MILPFQKGINREKIKHLASCATYYLPTVHPVNHKCPIPMGTVRVPEWPDLFLKNTASGVLQSLDH